MARRRIVLPGLSRSRVCNSPATGTPFRCLRLEGHKGDHRPTLTASIAPIKPAKVPAKAAKAPARKASAQCRISRRGERCALTVGHKAAGRRHRFGSAVRVIPMVESPRLVAASQRGARRPKAAPRGTNITRVESALAAVAARS